jgi:hypothetical protein
MGKVAVAQLVEALCDKPECCGSSPDKVDFFNWPKNSSHIMALGLTQSLKEMSTRNLPGVKGRSARKADKLTAICEPTV